MFIVYKRIRSIHIEKTMSTNNHARDLLVLVLLAAVLIMIPLYVCRHNDNATEDVKWDDCAHGRTNYVNQMYPFKAPASIQDADCNLLTIRYHVVEDADELHVETTTTRWNILEEELQDVDVSICLSPACALLLDIGGGGMLGSKNVARVNFCRSQCDCTSDCVSYSYEVDSPASSSCYIYSYHDYDNEECGDVALLFERDVGANEANPGWSASVGYWPSQLPW